MLRHRSFVIGLLPASTCILMLLALPASGQLPATRLDGVFPAGGAANSTIELKIAGNDLDDVDVLHFSHDGIKAERKIAEPGPFDEGPQPVENTYIVTIAGNVPAGQHTVRCQGKYGLSNPRTFVVGSTLEFVETESNNTVEEANEVALPIVINGQINNGPDLDWYVFEGKAGDRLILDCRAHRIDSPAQPFVTLCDEQGRTVAEHRRGVGDDPLDVVLPADGKYYIKVRDELYRGSASHVYRLVVGSLPIIDSIFPPAGLPGSNGQYTVYGRNLPGGQPSDFTLHGRPLEQLAVQIAIPADAKDQLAYSCRLDAHQAGLDGIEYRLDGPGGPSNPALVTLATAKVVLEEGDNNAPANAQRLTVPCEVAGRFYPQRDIDWYSFEAKEGDQLAIEVYSHRLGVPSDPAMLIQRVTTNDEGEEQTSDITWLDDTNKRDGGHEFDQRTTDPWYHFTAPADGVYRVLLREGTSSSRSDARLVYRLAIRPLQPDFRLVAVPGDSSGALLLRKGGRDVIRVIAFRRDGYEGEIRLNASGLPAGVTTSEVIIGPGSNTGSLVLTAADNAAAGVGTIEVAGTAKVGDQDVKRVARVGCAVQPFQFSTSNANIGSASSRLSSKIMVSVSEGEVAPVALTAGDGKPLETSRGGILKIPYTVKRADGVGGNITAVVLDAPRNSSIPTVSIGGNNKGEFQVRFTATTPPGTYTVQLSGFVQSMKYRRNPEAADRAAKEQERINKALADATKRSSDATQAARKAQTDVTNVGREVSQTTSAKTTADRALATTQAADKAATDALAKAKQSAESQPDDANLKQQLTNAEKAKNDAAKKLADATKAAEDAKKKFDEATAKQKAAQEAKTKADEEAKAAADFLRQAQQKKRTTDQQAGRLKSAANSRNFNGRAPSTPVTFKVTEFPIKLSGNPEKASVKQGEKVEIPFKVERLYDFKSNVSVQLRQPGGVGGLSIPNVNLPNNKADGKVTVTAQANATPGEHAFTLRLQMNFNGQNLVMERPLALTIDKVEAAE